MIRQAWGRFIAWSTRPGGWLGQIEYDEEDEFSDWARR